MEKNKRVLIIDEDEIRRAGIVHLLELMDENFIVNEANHFSQTDLQGLKKRPDGKETIGDGNLDGGQDGEADHKYDLLILSDTSNFNINTPDIINIKKSFPDSYIVASLSSNKVASDIFKLISVGVSGIISSDCGIGEIQGIIQQVLLGMVIFPSRILELDESAMDGPSSLAPAKSFDMPLSQLTKRQTAVLGLLVQGKSNHEIAEKLGIAENTVRVHLSAILKTLNASNRTQAAIIASTYLRNQEASRTGEP